MRFVRGILFSNLFISLCAAVMTAETLFFYTTAPVHGLLPFQGGLSPWTILFFIASGTLFSYNVHWLLGIGSSHDSARLAWTRRNRTLCLAIAALSALLALYFFWQMRWAWPLVLPAVSVTAIYTLPKADSFRALRPLAYGKTLLLALSWTYVTTLMPALIAGTLVGRDLLFFMLGRFFLVYAICLLFDHRDVESDLREGLTTLPARISETQLKVIFFSSIALSIAFMTLSVAPVFDFQHLTPVPRNQSRAMRDAGSKISLLTARLLPSLLLALLYKRATYAPSPIPHYAGQVPYSLSRITRVRSPIPSDLLFYGILDGIMMLSGLLSLALAF